MREVYITRVSSFLPNRVVENDNMEQYLGLIGDKPSRTRSIVLRQNGIKKGLPEFGVMVLCLSSFLMTNKYCKLINISSL